LLNTASDLLDASRGRPRQATLKRAASTIYYALFHCLARWGADLIIGSTQQARRQEAWRQVYRSLEHTAAYRACTNADTMETFTPAVRTFAITFADMQTKRHKADYDPTTRFRKSAVLEDLRVAQLAITEFDGAGVRDRRAFIAAVLLRSRSR
jgi:hypothetical protein